MNDINELHVITAEWMKCFSTATHNMHNGENKVLNKAYIIYLL